MIHINRTLIIRGACKKPSYGRAKFDQCTYSTPYIFQWQIHYATEIDKCSVLPTLVSRIRFYDHRLEFRGLVELLLAHPYRSLTGERPLSLLYYCLQLARRGVWRAPYP